MAAGRTWCYDWPHPAVTTDVVLFRVIDAVLEVALVRRARAPFAGRWALPGGFLDIDEDLDACAARELAEETGVRGVYLEQLYTFGAPDRDPRERVISVAYLGLTAPDAVRLASGSDAAAARWHPVAALPPLAFDHEQIVATARERLAAKLGYTTIALRLLPPEFTLGELQAVHEAVLGRPVDKRNFRRRMRSIGCLEATGRYRRNGNHRPALLYRPASPGAVEVVR